MHPTYRTVVADDNNEFRDWFRPLLQQRDEFQIIGEAESGRETLDICLDLLPDLLIIDIFMPDIEGHHVAAQLLKEAPTIKIILISANTGQVYVELAQNYGAVAFISKMSLTANSLLEALKGET